MAVGTAVKQYGFTEAELERAKMNYLSNLESALKEKDKRNSEDLVQEYTRNFLVGEAAPGIQMEYDLTKSYLSTAKLEDINALSPPFISDSNRDIIIMAPQKDSASLPNETTVNSWFNAVAKTKLFLMKISLKLKPLISDKLIPGKIINENKIEKLGFTEFTLSNGLKVILKPTDFKNDEIRFKGFSPGGTSLYPDSDFESATNAANMVENMGLGHFKPTDLQKILSGKRVDVEPFISERSEGIHGFSSPGDLETAMQLMYLYFTSPGRDSTLFNNVLEQAASEIANRYSDPQSVYRDTVDAVLGDYNIRRTGPSLEKLHQIDLDKIHKVL